MYILIYMYIHLYIYIYTYIYIYIYILEAQLRETLRAGRARHPDIACGPRRKNDVASSALGLQRVSSAPWLLWASSALRLQRVSSAHIIISIMTEPITITIAYNEFVAGSYSNEKSPHGILEQEPYRKVVL